LEMISTVSQCVYIWAIFDRFFLQNLNNFKNDHNDNKLQKGRACFFSCLLVVVKSWIKNRKYR